MEQLNELVEYIKQTQEYKNIIHIKEQMNNNKELLTLIKELKLIQKEYIKTNYSNKKIKEELDNKRKKLTSIPIYNEYIYNLEKVNEKLNYIEEELNEYFYKIFNE